MVRQNKNVKSCTFDFLKQGLELKIVQETQSKQISASLALNRTRGTLFQMLSISSIEGFSILLLTSSIAIFLLVLSKKVDILRFLVILFIIDHQTLMPVEEIVQIGSMSIFITDISLLICMILLIADPLKNYGIKRIYSRRSPSFFFKYYLITGITLFLAQFPFEFVVNFWRYVIHCYFFFLLGRKYTTYLGWNEIYKIVRLGSFIIVITALIKTLEAGLFINTSQYFLTERAILIQTATFVGMYILFTNIWIRKDSINTSLSYLAVLVIVLGQIRTIWIALAISLSLQVLLVRNRAKLKSRFLMPIILLFTAVYLLQENTSFSLESTFSDQGTWQWRLDYWQKLLSFDISGWQILFGSIAGQSDQITTYTFVQSLHNVYLYGFFFFGIVPLTFLVYPIGQLIFKYLNSTKIHIWLPVTLFLAIIGLAFMIPPFIFFFIGYSYDSNDISNVRN